LSGSADFHHHFPDDAEYLECNAITAVRLNRPPSALALAALYGGREGIRVVLFVRVARAYVRVRGLSDRTSKKRPALVRERASGSPRKI
jgi:hypothetical protein